MTMTRAEARRAEKEAPYVEAIPEPIAFIEDRMRDFEDPREAAAYDIQTKDELAEHLIALYKQEIDDLAFPREMEYLLADAKADGERMIRATVRETFEAEWTDE
jgi:hypothetical protein